MLDARAAPCEPRAGMQQPWLGLAALVVTALGSAGCAPPPVPPAPPSPVQVEGAMLVSRQAGESVLVFAAGFARYGRHSTSRYRYLRLHSLKDGALLASEIFNQERGYSYDPYDKATCEPALPGQLWCLAGLGKGLTVRDSESLRTVAEQRQILGGTPELAGEPPFRHMLVDPKTRGFVFESRDGYAWIIDPGTRALTRFAGSIHSIPELGELGQLNPSNPAMDLRSRGPVLGDSTYRFDDETRATLLRDGKPVHPEHTYLRGKLVEDQHGLVVLDDPPRVLVVEEVVDGRPILWSVLADGAAQWKVTNLPGDVMDAKLYRDTLVLVTKSLLVALRTQDGAVVWTSPP